MFLYFRTALLAFLFVLYAGAQDKYDKFLELTFTNLAYQQPFSPIFVMVHNEDAEPIFKLGEPTSEALATMAEDGNPQPLIDHYREDPNVLDAGAVVLGAPFYLGEEVRITIRVTDTYKYVSVATKATNTNDCFVALNKVKLEDGDMITAVGYDAGSEENNEMCSSMPGPACPPNSGNVRSFKGEGYVHVHRGFHGVGDLPAEGYDWRSPMMRVDVKGGF